MLILQISKNETPIAGTRHIMPQEKKSKTVELIDNGTGDGTAIYRVGRKMIYITFGEDSFKDDLFVTTIVNAYVKTLKTQQGYLVPDTFEMDKKTGLPKEITKEDERLLVEQVAKNEIFSIANSKDRGESPGIHRTVGKYFSTENGVVYSNPTPPPNSLEHKKDIRLIH